MQNIADILDKKDIEGDSRNKYEFQAYGNRLAEEFGDPQHRSLYIKLAKEEDRSLVERAREFVLRSENATTKGRLFMWKLSELKKERKQKKKRKTSDENETD
ncbi:hypothetical protein GF360_00445 [candidate division WWE3 bacterium]|nr:hypothetical protein [candidate division WWE3 bacterium]